MLVIASTEVITNRLEYILDNNQTIEQAGFRRSFSTMDHIHTLNQMKEKYMDYNIPYNISMVFVDYEKAFDFVETKSRFEALQEQRINSTYIKLIRNMYKNSSTQSVYTKIATK